MIVVILYTTIFLYISTENVVHRYLVFLRMEIFIKIFCFGILNPFKTYAAIRKTKNLTIENLIK